MVSFCVDIHMPRSLDDSTGQLMAMGLEIHHIGAPVMDIKTACATRVFVPSVYNTGESLMNGR